MQCLQLLWKAGDMSALHYPAEVYWLYSGGFGVTHSTRLLPYLLTCPTML